MPDTTSTTRHGGDAPELFTAPLAVRSVPRPEGFPERWQHVVITMPDRAGVDAHATACWWGAPGGDEQRDAVVSAVLGIWCGEYQDQFDVEWATADDLRRRGSGVVDLGEFALHADVVYEGAGSPFVTPRDGDRLPWVWAYGVSAGRVGDEVTVSQTGRGAWVPATQVVVRWPDAFPAAPRNHDLNFAGLACGDRVDGGNCAAFAELLAEDAALRWWYTGQSATGVVEHDTIGAGIARSTVRLLSRVGSPCCVVRVRTDDGVMALGWGSTLDAATSKALRLLQCAIDMDDPSGSLHRRVPGLLPHHRERSYVDPEGTYRHLVDPMGHVQLALDPQVVRLVDERLTCGAVSTQLAAQTVEGWGVDVTTADAKRGTSARCVRVVAPGLARLGVGAFPQNRERHGLEWVSSNGFDAAVPFPGW